MLSKVYLKFKKQPYQKVYLDKNVYPVVYDRLG